MVIVKLMRYHKFQHTFDAFHLFLLKSFRFMPAGGHMDQK